MQYVHAQCCFFPIQLELELVGFVCIQTKQVTAMLKQLMLRAAATKLTYVYVEEKGREG
jgi:hypothetical protein